MTAFGTEKTKLSRSGKTTINVRYVWLRCPACSLGKWQRAYQDREYIETDKVTAKFQCPKCASRKSRSLPKPGDRIKQDNGYVVVYLEPSDPFYSMAKSGAVAEHRYIMAKVLGRAIVKGEAVHHKNGKRADNHPDNLELWVRAHPSGQRAEDVTVAFLNHISDAEFRRILSKTKHATYCV